MSQVKAYASSLFYSTPIAAHSSMLTSAMQSPSELQRLRPRIRHCFALARTLLSRLSHLLWLGRPIVSRRRVLISCTGMTACTGRPRSDYTCHALRMQNELAYALGRSRLGRKV